MSWNIVARYRRFLDQETGTVVKDWGGKIPVGLAFANTYHTGMSNLGFQAIYGLFNDYQDVVCERFFLPDRDLAAEHARTGTPLLSVESQKTLDRFELAAFSLSHENDYPGVLSILSLARMPWRRADRGEDGPLILAGGVTMRLNPEPMADFLDLILVGDGEEIVPDLLRAWREIRSEPLPKTERILHLARMVPGAYAPGNYEAALDREGRLISFGPDRNDLPERIRVVRVRNAEARPLASRILTPATEFADTGLVEVGRGCGRGCRFCLAGFAYRPPRFFDRRDILAALDRHQRPAGRIGLVSPAAADHPDIEGIVRELTGQGRQVTISSLRLASLTHGLVEALIESGLKSAAVAPEAGSERLRAFVNKNLTEPQILDGTAMLAEAGIKRLKLYFMIGLPSETRDDLLALADLVKKIKDRLVRGARGRSLTPQITLSISCFVPKAFTPFQRQPMIEVKELQARARLVRGRLSGVKGLRVNFDVPKWGYLQALLSRADRRGSALIEALAGGDSLVQAKKRVTFNPDYFVTRSMEGDGMLPWDFIDHGFETGYMETEFARARDGRASPLCRPDVCRVCGICPA
ncbi:MAG: radical SAM protein [Proteobacteria bacterium]|nr:radical SAM protein [Pseudomonadota bacterium]